MEAIEKLIHQLQEEEENSTIAAEEVALENDWDEESMAIESDFDPNEHVSEEPFDRRLIFRYIDECISY